MPRPVIKKGERYVVINTPEITATVEEVMDTSIFMKFEATTKKHLYSKWVSYKFVRESMRKID